MVHARSWTGSEERFGIHHAVLRRGRRAASPLSPMPECGTAPPHGWLIPCQVWPDLPEFGRRRATSTKLGPVQSTPGRVRRMQHAMQSYKPPGTMKRLCVSCTGKVVERVRLPRHQYKQVASKSVPGLARSHREAASPGADLKETWPHCRVPLRRIWLGQSQGPSLPVGR